MQDIFTIGFTKKKVQSIFEILKRKANRSHVGCSIE